jgi:hypothetical protein
VGPPAEHPLLGCPGERSEEQSHDFVPLFISLVYVVFQPRPKQFDTGRLLFARAIVALCHILRFDHGHSDVDFSVGGY